VLEQWEKTEIHHSNTPALQYFQTFIHGVVSSLVMAERPWRFIKKTKVEINNGRCG
jgi:hypothetical protein